MTSRRVTAIVPNPRKPGRFSLEVESENIATLSIEAIERLRLVTGAAFDDRIAADVEREAGILATYDRALGMLAVRGRASHDLRCVLVKKGEPAACVDVAIERLERAGFLNDASFARHFTRAKVIGGGLSRRRVQQELTKRGVPREVSVEAIDAVFVEEGVDEEVSLERIARKKLRTLVKVGAPTRKRRLYSFLARRGYDGSDIVRVIRIVLADVGDWDE